MFDQSHVSISCFMLISFSASIKMNLKGCSIVLNDDGTEINDDEVLEIVKDLTLILLQSNETWKADDSGDNASGTSTLTYQSTSSAPSSLSSFTESEETIIENATISYDGTQVIEQPLISYQDKITDEIITTDETGINQTKVDPPPIYIVVSPSGTATASENTPLIPINESTWQNFQLPLDKIPKYMIDACETGATKDRRITTEVIHIVVNEMRAIKTIIPAMAFRHVARQLADKFPKSFLDKDEDGTIIGNGTHSTVCRLQDRSNYLNRPHKRKSLTESSPPVLKMKQLSNRRAGCSNWQPEECHSSKDDDDFSSMKVLLKTITENHPEYYTYLEKTYAEQRKYINSLSDPKTSTAAQVREEWLVLYRSSAILWHFKKLTHSQFPNEEEFKMKCNKILKYGEKKNFELHEQDDSFLKALEVLCLHFNENLGAFLFKFKVYTFLDSV